MKSQFLIATITVLHLIALSGCNAGPVDASEATSAVEPPPGGEMTTPDLRTHTSALVNGERIRLRAAHSLKCLDVYGASPYDGAKVVQWDCTGGSNQAFTAYVQPNGSWELRAVHSGKCLDIPNGSVHDGVQLQQWSCNGGNNQHFWITYKGGAYAIQPTYSGKCLDVWKYGLSNGDPVVQWTCNYNLNQLFYIESAG